MLHTLKSELEKAGFEQTQKVKKVIPMFKILHIPTATFILEYDDCHECVKPVIVNKAMAGKIIDIYRKGIMTRKSANKNVMTALYFIEDELTEIQKTTKSNTVLFFRLRNSIILRKAELQRNPLSAAEFDLISV